MLLLRGTTDKLQVITGSAGTIQPEIDVSYASAAAPPVIQVFPDLQALAAISSATTTDLVDSTGLSSGAVYNVKRCSLFNAHASVSNLLTIQVVDGTRTSIIWNGTLLPGEMIVLDELGYWTLYGTDGVAKPAQSKLDAKLRVANDVTFATAATFADVTGLTQALKAGKNYCFEAHLYHISNATTTGAQFGVNIGAAPTILQIATIDTVTASVTASVHSAGATNTRDTAATAQTTGSAAITMAILSGSITPSADGTFAIRCTSEVTVASGVIVKQGSWCRIWETDN